MEGWYYMNDLWCYIVPSVIYCLGVWLICGILKIGTDWDES